jgi:hypothetical protein
MTDLPRLRLWPALVCTAVAAGALAVLGSGGGTPPPAQVDPSRDLRSGPAGEVQGRAEPERLAAQARGRALFEGQTDLRGRLAGHELPLPVLATRCANCHETSLTAGRALPSGLGTVSTPTPPAPQAAPRGSWTSALAQAPPSLRAQDLSAQRSRRGGPPSSYDAQRLCLLLRSGRDAADVLVSTTMPRYDLSDAQCADLWAFLGTPGAAL